MKKIILTLGLGLFAAGLVGCETSADRQLASGQACLDSITTTVPAQASAQAATCVSLVQGLSSPESYLVRCSANFVGQGFTASRIASSIDKIKNGSPGTDQMVGMMAYLVFNVGANATAKNLAASDAVTNCNRSGVNSMIRLAQGAQIATSIANGTVDPTSPTAVADLNAIVQSYVAGSNPALEISLGQSAVTATAAYCGVGSSYETTKVCTDLKAALASSTNPQTIGATLLAQLKVP